jgi:uncharacterized protein
MADITSSVPQRAARRNPMRELTVFVVAAFAGAWIVGGIAYVGLDLGEAGLGAGVLMVAVAALVLTYRDEGSVRPMIRQIVSWRLGVRWYAVALVLPAALVAVALSLASLAGGESIGTDAPALATVLTLPLYILVLGGPEELGWRGYALPRLQARFTALPATLMLAAIWMAWHLPVLLVPNLLFDTLPIAPYFVIGVASSVVYTWLYNSTGGSVLMAMVLHGSGNLALLWMPSSTVTWAALAAGWVVVALGVVVASGPVDLARGKRHRVGYEDARHVSRFPQPASTRTKEPAT